jgi:hypothetical protein
MNAGVSRRSRGFSAQIVKLGRHRQGEIDHSTRDALSSYIRADVERDALRIF